MSSVNMFTETDWQIFDQLVVSDSNINIVSNSFAVDSRVCSTQGPHDVYATRFFMWKNPIIMVLETKRYYNTACK